MPTLAQTLVTVALATAIVAAAPTAEKAVRRAVATAAVSSSGHSSDPTRRRSKRQIVIEEAPVIDEEEQIKQELSELSDAQLRVLADIVQTEIERFNEEEQPEYEIIEIPDEVITPGRMRRNEAILEATPELVVVPDELIEDALIEQEDEMELRMRIAEIASILNERATRRGL